MASNRLSASVAEVRVPIERNTITDKEKGKKEEGKKRGKKSSPGGKRRMQSNGKNRISPSVPF